MFNKAIKDWNFTNGNPAAGIKLFHEEKRDRFLGAEELPAFFDALNAEPNESLRDFFMLALLCGARKANILSMRWVDIDFTHNLWRIPETKSGMPVVIPLVAPAVEVLYARRKVTKDSEWVFPSHGATGHLVEPKSAWERILKRAGLEDVRIHDLRRTLGSWQAMGGASLPIIGKSLGHTQVSTTAIYARLTVDPVRESVDRATTAIIDASKKKSKKGNKPNGEADADPTSP